ncbi:hypothetical protein B0H21DRAFT_818977 [Amylocystis lapponica]|nr:hypothetical protein B0H21DRAFT_818977 [Amylocystis lapponica]
MLAGDAGLCISSPNMDFVPEVPVHRPDADFTFFADGMLHTFELYKCPQGYDHEEPHGVAAPANPQILADRSLAAHPLLDEQSVLPAWKDTAIPWVAMGPRDFATSLDLPDQAIGFLARPLVERLRSAARDVIAVVDAVCVRKYGAVEGQDPDVARQCQGRSTFIWHRIKCLWRAISRLQELLMSSFDVLLWFREAQRILLEARAWATYESVVTRRLTDPMGDHSARVLPLRGAITSNVTVVEELWRIGVPVWYLQPVHTLISNSTIIKVNEVVSASRFMSQNPTMQHEKHNAPAPAWGHSSTVNPLTENLTAQIRRYSLTSKPRLRTIPVWEEQTVKEEPAQYASGVPSNNGQASASGRGAMGKKKAKGRSGKRGAQDPQRQPPPTSPPPPLWLSSIADCWKEAVTSVGTLHPHESKALLYPCISSTRKVPLWACGYTTGFGSWRIALEGAYHAIAITPTGPQPLSSPKDIARLPPAPQPTKHLRTSDAPPSQNDRNRKRPRDRLDISVRFGVHAGIPPYTGDETPMWRAREVTRADADTDRRLAAEVVWELSVLLFQLELLDLDPELAPASGTARLTAADREFLLPALWSDEQTFYPAWMPAESQPCLYSPSWRTRKFVVEDVYLPFERRVLVFYMQSFHRVRGRMPTLPLVCPAP